MLSCICGNGMSLFESDRFGKCGYCYDSEAKAERERVQRESDERKRQVQEKLRLEKEEELRKRSAAKQSIIEKLKQIEGKTIESVEVVEWTVVFGSDRLKRIRIDFDDGSLTYFEQEEDSDGCRGHYDYAQYLDVAVIIPEADSEVILKE